MDDDLKCGEWCLAVPVEAVTGEEAGRAGGSKDERPSIDRGLFTSGASTSLESVNTPRHLLDLSERIAC